VSAAPNSRTARATIALRDALLRRLPEEGPVLALGALPVAYAPARPGVERRELDDTAGIEPGALAPGAWSAILLGAQPGTPWAETIDRVRGALAPQGRLLVIVPGGAGAGAQAQSELVGAVYEAGFCLLREEEVELDAAATDESGRRGGAALLEARPDSYVVRSFRPGDEEPILGLFAASFSPPRGLDHWRWKYRDNPFGALAISCAFAPDGALVAHYAAYPVPFRRSRGATATSLLCHQVGDTMTDRRYRDVGRGNTSLLARTARHFYARRCEGRVAWNYGFNTGNIQRFSELFVGARKVWDLELWSCRAAELRLADARRFRPYRVSRVDRLDAAFDDLFERVAAEHGLLVERRRPYLEWRYLRCPDRDYWLLRVDQGSRLRGWAVFLRAGDRLLWGDALFDPDHPEALSAALRSAIAIPGAEVDGGARVEGWFSRHPPWWPERLAALGFAAAPDPQDLGMVFVPFLECPDDELRQRYYLTMGDGDLF
jgi:hypothetical protein